MVVVAAVLAAYAVPLVIAKGTGTTLRPFAYPAAAAVLCAGLWWVLDGSAVSPWLGWIAVGFAVQAAVNVALYRWARGSGHASSRDV